MSGVQNSQVQVVRSWGVVGNGHSWLGVSVWGDENILKLMAVVIQLNILETSELYRLCGRLVYESHVRLFSKTNVC